MSMGCKSQARTLATPTRASVCGGSLCFETTAAPSASASTTLKASFECFRFFSSENLKIWKIAAADCANWKFEITSRFSVFQIGMILIANLKKFLQIFSFSDDHVWVQPENWRHKSETARKHIGKSEECSTQTCFSELLKTRPFPELHLFRSEVSETLKRGL